MNALVVGFEVEETKRLSQELRAVGHHVLGAVGKAGAQTFLRAVAPDVVVVPQGPDGERAREWVREVGVEVRFVEVAPGASAQLTPASPTTATLPASPAPAPVAPSSPAPVAASAPPPLPPSRKEARPDGDAAQVREPHPDLVSKLAQVRFGDYHSILEVEPGGSPYAVREQRDRLARRFSPRGWPGRLNPDEIDMLSEISRGIADAFLILSDPELAVRYERALAGARPTPSTPDR